MKERLPGDTYRALKKTIEEGKPLDPSLASVVANSMKDWAIEKGATHYTHWFQPMTGVTAEKHDSFISPQEDGSVIMEFSGKALSRGEPDASSFPSGGLRATFEARGYTAWDPTSYAFIKDGTLCIPTAFCSFGGEALDMKTPLLRSMNALDLQARRILALFGNPAKRVSSMTGAEQEYFLIDRDSYNRRRDLKYTGRTLYGNRPPKGQEMDDHYFGSIRIRVSAYMKELNEELWKLGVFSKTEHNEAAPSQHELAPVFSKTNVACDHNQITMELMRKVAKRHGLTCLLHEKPFEGVNGSGKHNNWSLCTDRGVNLLDPGTTPADNAQFLLFFCAVIKAVDEYQELLRISVATGSNDYRLGGNEAPPAIVSVFVGGEMEAILDAIEHGLHYSNNDEHANLQIGVDVLPVIPKETTDRNRTSPFAFTGNRFEFRMPGSSSSIALPNIMINTIVAESLRQFADELESAGDFSASLNRLIRRTVTEHRRITFNGNGYDGSWVAEAERRGLANLRTAADAVPHLLDKKNMEVLARHGIYTEVEIRSHCEILLENYCKSTRIEALTMLDMARADIMPAVFAFEAALAGTANAKREALSGVSLRAETELLERVAKLADEFADETAALENAVAESEKIADSRERAQFSRDAVRPGMARLRRSGDALEALVGASYWPYPSYGTLLYNV